MNKHFALLVALLLLPTIAKPQVHPDTAKTAPPKILLLVHQTFLPGKTAAREELEVAMSQACNRLSVPLSWIALDSVTGRKDAVSFDPFDSFASMEVAGEAWAQVLRDSHQVARLQEEINDLVASEHAVIATRRDDVGYRASSIDLSRARILRTLEVRVHPGREKDFVDAFKVLAAAYEKTNSDLPWVVYQVNSGLPSPTFIIFVPMHALRQNDDLLSRRQAIQAAEGEAGFEQMQQIARDAYETTESNIYAIHPEMSHVPSEFISGDPDFWSPTPELPKPRRKKPD